MSQGNPLQEVTIKILTEDCAEVAEQNLRTAIGHAGYNVENIYTRDDILNDKSSETQ